VRCQIAISRRRSVSVKSHSKPGWRRSRSPRATAPPRNVKVIPPRSRSRVTARSGPTSSPVGLTSFWIGCHADRPDLAELHNVSNAGVTLHLECTKADPLAESRCRSPASSDIKDRASLDEHQSIARALNSGGRSPVSATCSTWSCAQGFPVHRHRQIDDDRSPQVFPASDIASGASS
jgi:hypothetical protein